MFRMIVLALIALSGYAGASLGAPAKEVPVAPTLQDAHEFFQSQVAPKSVAALYTASRDGELLGYINFPLLRYKGSICNSEISLSNGVRIGFDWALVNRLEIKDGQMAMWRSQNVIYENFHMITVEGGVQARPSNNIPKLILAINNEISRNRLVKAMSLLSSTCRAKSKFD